MAAAPGTEIVFLTALGLEYDAVRAHLTAASARVDPDGTHYTVGELAGGGPRVALALIGEGNLTAAVQAARAIQEFRPKALILAGVAGGLSDELAVGDIVVATRIHTYQGGREESETFRPRAKGWPVAHGLEQAARAVAHSGTWFATPDGGLGTGGPRVHFKPIVSGDVVLDSRTSPLARLIDTYYSDAVAIDMESAGVAEAAHRHSAQTITVRGISDAADGHKRHSDASGAQHQAAAHAAAFAAALARRIAPVAPRPPDSPAPAEGPAGPRRLAAGRAGVAISRWVRPAYLLSAVLVAAVSLLIYAGATGLFRDAAGSGTPGVTATPSNQDTAPPASGPPSPGPGWVVVRQGRDVALADEQELDLETGAATWVGQVPDGPDLRMARMADRVVVTPPGNIKLLDTTGPEVPERCTAEAPDGWDGSRNGLWHLTPGRNLCVSGLERSRYAMLTVVRPPNAGDPVLTFHYTLWERTG